MILTEEQIRRYFEHRLAGQRIARQTRPSVKCPFHADSAPSMTLFLDGAGGFFCHAGSCGARGNVFQFEARLTGCDLYAAEGNIARIVGAQPSPIAPTGRLTAAYDYRQANGSLSFQKRRYEAADGRKTFRILRPDALTGWTAGIGEQPKVLYHLPELVTANVVLVCEGEKDCETLDALELGREMADVRIATTTNFEGAWQLNQAAKWLPEYTAYFAGKRVVLFPDNDEAGRARCAYLAEQLVPLAVSVRTVSLPGLAEKGDVTDWLREHTRAELEEQIRLAPLYKPVESAPAEREVLIPAVEFLATALPEADWMLAGVIEAGSNGFIVADPKAGKSVAAIDLALSLACGIPWLNLAVPRPVRTALVSREDNPAMTQRRMLRLLAAKGGNGLFEENLYVNTSVQTPTLMLDNPAELAELIRALKRHSSELCILDVFNRLHNADENDNTEMVAVLGHIKRIQIEAGCSVAVVHHFNKAAGRNLQTRLRGSSAIAGFAEWIVGISEADAETHLLEMEFVTKSASAPPPILYRITDIGAQNEMLRLEVDRLPAPRRRQTVPTPVLSWQDRREQEREMV